jgi:predicted nucleotidyltransferase
VTWLLQSLVLCLNLPALKPLFQRIYDFGLRRAVAALSRHPAVFCILGTGSYFEGRAVYGLSDVDLIIVLNERVSRADGAVGEIAYTYGRLRRIFPFLGPWEEREANLIFLSEVAAGFPVLERISIRLKQGRLVPLYGELPRDIVSGAVTTIELLGEINTLLRSSVMADPRHPRRLIFWKRIFMKLTGLAELLELKDWSREVRERVELTFLGEDDALLFFRKGEPERLFELQLALSRQIFDLVAGREPKLMIRPVLVAAADRPSYQQICEQPWPPAPGLFSAALERPNGQLPGTRNIPSVHIALVSGLPYFSVDESIPLLEIHQATYDGLQRLRQVKPGKLAPDETALVSANGFLFIATRKQWRIEILPLDSVQFASVYAAVFGDSLEFEVPASILAEQQATTAAMFRGYAYTYRVDGSMVTKLSQPCIYREHDAEVIESALRLLRARVAGPPEWTLIESASDLFEYFRQRYPGCEYFLNELERYRRCLHGDLSLGETSANNLYHCLHQFMSQALTGAKTITIDPPNKHLDITIGVITRNRANDLEAMLESLTRQRRAPDEVVVVDNGSTDRTQSVLEKFRDRLPLRCEFLAGADIPGARNLVLETAAHEIVSFIDDDCISEPEWLAAVEAGFLRGDNIGVVGGWVIHQPAPRHSTVDNYYNLFHHVKA